MPTHLKLRSLRTDYDLPKELYDRLWKDGWDIEEWDDATEEIVWKHTTRQKNTG